MNWEEIQSIYPINEETIWLNNCGTTPSNSRVLETLNEFLNDYSKNGVLGSKFPYPKIKAEILNTLSTLLNCDSNELSLIHNTAEGMQFISHDYPFSSGDEILLLENEYPSNVYPWQHLTKNGVIIKTIEVKNSKEDFLKSFEKFLNPKLKMVSFSITHWCTGFTIPMFEIGNLCNENNVEFVLDGAQGVGVVPVDVKKNIISYMAFPVWKWLLGPLGLGILYISNEKLERLNFSFKGTSSVKQPLNYLPHQEEIIPSAQRYEYSTPNYLDWIYFWHQLNLLSSLGFEQIRQRILSLANYLVDALKINGFEVREFGDNKYQHGIVTFKHPKVSTERIFPILEENKIIGAERLGYIRFSPHIYNSEKQIDKVIQVLKSCVA